MVKQTADVPQGQKLAMQTRVGRIIALTLWTGAGFFIGQLIIVGLAILLQTANIDLANFDESVVSAVIAAASYVLAFLIVAGGVWLVTKQKPTLATFGIQRPPRWAELGLGVVGFLVYIVASGLVMQAVISSVPEFNVDQVQDVGFTFLSSRYQYLLAFVTLVIIAPLAEEVLFRGFLYGKIRQYAPWWTSTIIVSLLFGAAHMQWNVAIDTFVLSLFLCGLRELFGSVWAGVTVHMIKNGIAFYFLFINPLLLPSLGS